jgi:hypothetical protein
VLQISSSAKPAVRHASAVHSAHSLQKKVAVGRFLQQRLLENLWHQAESITDTDEGFLHQIGHP